LNNVCDTYKFNKLSLNSKFNESCSKPPLSNNNRNNNKKSNITENEKTKNILYENKICNTNLNNEYIFKKYENNNKSNIHVQVNNNDYVKSYNNKINEYQNINK
jgi:hypothetical protein